MSTEQKTTMNAGEWMCRVCRFVNPEEVTTCQVCAKKAMEDESDERGEVYVPTHTTVFQVGDRVLARQHRVAGTIRFVGSIPESNRDGVWYGIELDQPVGYTDGRYPPGDPNGKRYFEAKEGFGIYTRIGRLVAFDSRHQAAAIIQRAWFQKLQRQKDRSENKDEDGAVDVALSKLQPRRIENPKAFHARKLSSSVPQNDAATKIQKVFRGLKGRADARDECLWQAFNEMDWKDEHDLTETYDGYEEMMRTQGLARQSSVKRANDIMVRRQRTKPSATASVARAKADKAKSDKAKWPRFPPKPKAAADGKPVSMVTKEYVQQATDLLARGERMPLRHLTEILVRVTSIFRQYQNVVETSVDIKYTVVGDIHGQLDDLLYIFQLNGTPGARNQYLFNGDFVDRGQDSIECITIMLLYKLLYPEYVHLNRGNHEARDINSRDGFQRECDVKYKGSVFSMFSTLFSCLPLATIIDNGSAAKKQRVFVVHGGLFEKDMTIDDIQQLDRFHQIPPKRSLMQQALWSDPKKNIAGRVRSKRGAGVNFGQDVTKKFLDMNQCHLIIRSHEVKRKGYEWMHANRLLTVFSASNYVGRVGNYGAYVILEKDPLTSKLVPRILQYMAKPNPNNKLTNKARQFQDYIVKKLRERIAANRLRLIDYYRSCEDETHTISRKQWAEGLHHVLQMDLAFHLFADPLGVPVVSVKKLLFGEEAEDATISDASRVNLETRIDYMAFLGQFEPKLQALDPLSVQRQDSLTDVPEEKKQEARMVIDMIQLMFEHRFELISLFQFFDGDGNGGVTAEEFATGLNSLKKVLHREKDFTEEHVQALVKSLDTDGDGVIQFSELFDSFSVFQRRASVAQFVQRK